MEEMTQQSFQMQIRQMSINDLPLCRHLVQEAGWNQVDADWLRAMELEPEGCFVAETGDLPVATTTTCCFGNIGWIAMVLVDKKARGQGIAKYMVEHAVAYLESRGVGTIRLDATAMGQGLYKKLGFDEEYEVIRFAGNPYLTEYKPENSHTLLSNSSALENIIALDEEVTATARRSFINSLISIASSPFCYYKIPGENQVTGYAGYREGTTAVQIGPAIALTPASGQEVLDAVVSHFIGKKMYIDIPVPSEPALMWAETHGFTEQRRFVRMFRGIKIHDSPQLIWASSGPEKG